MKKIYALSAMSLLFSIILSACSISAPQPTPTVKPSETPLPTFTNTPVPTNTPKPTNTPTVEPTLALGDTEVVKLGGYSFRPPVGYKVAINQAQAVVADGAGTLILSIYGSTSNPQDQSPDEIADSFIKAVFKKGNGEYEKGTPYAINIDGADGSAYDITGTLFGKPVVGQAIVVMPDKNQYVFGLGLAITADDKKLWENEGSKVFSVLINSITFSTPEQTGVTSPCVISTDSTYGYTEENPIKVGGGDFGGPPRERAFLDNLAGPKGEIISYERTGSMASGDTILDAFVITGLSKQVTLFIDEYSYSEPQAPVGFNCLAAFPLAKP